MIQVENAARIGNETNSLVAIFACFNRREKTERCIRTLADGNPSCRFTFVAADDGSTDGTGEMLRRMQAGLDIHILTGRGDWFYSGGMRQGMLYALGLPDAFDYMLMVNDDVEFTGGSIERLIAQSREQGGAVIAGAMMDRGGNLQYGARRCVKGKFHQVLPSEWEAEADTFVGNCVLMPYAVFQKAGAMDAHYRHSLGDLDYGLRVKRLGCKIHGSKEFAGICENDHSPERTWKNATLPRWERVKIKESVKGDPTGPWFYFLRKNFGLLAALRGVAVSYARIALGR